MFAAEYVTIDGVKYQLDGGMSTPFKWGEIEHYACIQAYTESEVSIPKSFLYNGIEYYVTGYKSNVDNSTVVRFEIQDDVTINLEYYSFVPKNVKTLVIGKNVNIITTTNSYGSFATNSLEEIYCKDEIPMPLCTFITTTSAAGSISLGDASLAKRANIKVYVPKGAERTYRHTIGWSSYVNIIGLEELGDVTESNVTSSSFNFNQKSAIIDTHTVTALPIAIDNKNEVSAIEFDMVLPANVEVQGENPITGSERGAEMSFSTTTNEDGSLHVVATATTALAAGKGNIATIAVQTAKSDNYAITLRNVKVTTKTGKVISLDNEVLQFVANHKKGDYNEDGDVDIVDAQNLLDYVLGI